MMNHMISADKTQIYNQELCVCYFGFCIVVLGVLCFFISCAVDAVSVQKAEVCFGGRPLPPRLSGAHQKPQRNVLHPSESGHVVSTKQLQYSYKNLQTFMMIQ